MKIAKEPVQALLSKEEFDAKQSKQFVADTFAGKRIIGGSPLVFGESSTKGRIKNILNYKKPVLGIILVSLLIVAVVAIGLIANPKKEDISVLSFPTNQNGKKDYNAHIYEIEPFALKLKLPKKWRIQKTEEEEAATLPYTDGFTPINLYEGDVLKATVSYNVFDVNSEEELSQSDYFKAVYLTMRLGSMCRWDPYTPIKTTDTTETAIAVVTYLDPDEIDNYPGAMPSVSQVEVSGILSYDKEMGVYIAIQFAENAVSDQQVKEIAESVSLSRETSGVGSPIRDTVMGEGTTQLSNGKAAEIKLVMTEGRYLIGDDVALGGGFAEKNYVGECEIQVFVDDERIATYPLDNAKGFTEQFVFNNIPFSIEFEDYNEDTNPDFTIGQWGSSSMNLYTLFTVGNEGQISLLPEPNIIITSEQKGKNDYGASLTHKGKAIVTYRYNNAIGQNEETVYPYDEDSKMFVSSQEIVKPLTFWVKPDETAQVIGNTAAEIWLNSLKAETVSDKERLADYIVTKVNIIEANPNNTTSTGENKYHYLVQATYNITTATEEYVSSADSISGKGTFEGLFRELYIKSLDNSNFEIVSVGMGGEEGKLGDNRVTARILEINSIAQTMLVEGIGTNNPLGDKCLVSCKDTVFEIPFSEFQVGDTINIAYDFLQETYPTTTSAKWIGLIEATSPTAIYTITKFEENNAKGTRSFFSETEYEVIADSLFQYMLSSSGQPGNDITQLKQYYKITQTLTEDSGYSETHEYYTYLDDGEPVMQREVDSFYSKISKQSYDAIVSLFEKQISIMTANDGAPIGCEFGITQRMDTLEMLSALEGLQGFVFDVNAVSHQYVAFQFPYEKPKNIYLHYISQNEWQTEYPIDSRTYQIKVPVQKGVYHFFADVTWNDNDTETIYFSITVQ